MGGIDGSAVLILRASPRAGSVECCFCRVLGCWCWWLIRGFALGVMPGALLMLVDAATLRP